MAVDRNVEYLLILDAVLPPKSYNRVVSQLDKLSSRWEAMMQSKTARALKAGGSLAIKGAKSTAMAGGGLVGLMMGATQIANNKLLQAAEQANNTMEGTNSVRGIARTMNTSESNVERLTSVTRVLGIDDEKLKDLFIKFNEQITAGKIQGHSATFEGFNTWLKTIVDTQNGEMKNTALIELFGGEAKDFFVLFNASLKEIRGISKNVNTKEDEKVQKEFDSLNEKQKLVRIEQEKLRDEYRAKFAGLSNNQVKELVTMEDQKTMSQVANTLSNIEKLQKTNKEMDKVRDDLDKMMLGTLSAISPFITQFAKMSSGILAKIRKWTGDKEQTPPKTKAERTASEQKLVGPNSAGYR